MTFLASLLPPLPSLLRVASCMADNAEPFARAVALARADVRGFAAVEDRWYAPIRQMARSATSYPLPVTRAA